MAPQAARDRLLRRKGRVSLGKRTFYFCREHGDQLFALEWTKTLPPAEWLGESEQAVTGEPPG